MDLIRDKVDKLLLELSSGNLINIAKNLNIDVKEEKNKRTLLQLIQKYIDNINQEEHLRTLINGFKKDYETKDEIVADASGDKKTLELHQVIKRNLDNKMEWQMGIITDCKLRMLCHVKAYTAS